MLEIFTSVTKTCAHDLNKIVTLSSLYWELRFSPIAPYRSDHLRCFQNFNIGSKMPKDERAILALSLFSCKE